LSRAWYRRRYWYNAAAYNDFPEQIMSEQTDREREEDGKADAIAATAIITIVVLVMYVWLSGMPG
jgi:hypothetical protein